MRAGHQIAILSPSIGWIQRKTYIFSELLTKPMRGHRASSRRAAGAWRWHANTWCQIKCQHLMAPQHLMASASCTRDAATTTAARSEHLRAHLLFVFSNTHYHIMSAPAMFFRAESRLKYVFYFRKIRKSHSPGCWTLNFWSSRSDINKTYWRKKKGVLNDTKLLLFRGRYVISKAVQDIIFLSARHYLCICKTLSLYLQDIMELFARHYGAIWPPGARANLTWTRHCSPAAHRIHFGMFLIFSLW